MNKKEKQKSGFLSEHVWKRFSDYCAQAGEECEGWGNKVKVGQK